MNCVEAHATSIIFIFWFCFCFLMLQLDSPSYICRQLLCFYLNIFQAGQVFLFPSVALKNISTPFWSLSFEIFKQKSGAQLCGHIQWHNLLPVENVAGVKREEEKFYIYIKENGLEKMSSLVNKEGHEINDESRMYILSLIKHLLQPLMKFYLEI